MASIPKEITEFTRVPFTRKMVEALMTHCCVIAERCEQIERELNACEVKEVKEAYALVYADYKWKFVLAVRDLWFWSMNTDEHKQHILKHGY